MLTQDIFTDLIYTAYNVVMNHMSPLLGKGHSVYTDNFYSSPQLFQDFKICWKNLLLLRVQFAGIEKIFQKKFDTMSKINRGHSIFAYHDNITVCRWFDNKDVYCISIYWT